MTVKAMPNETTVAMTAPIVMASALPATSAHTLRHSGVG